MNKDTTQPETASVSQNDGKKKKTVEVQLSVKWVNFNVVLEASSMDDVYEQLEKLRLGAYDVTAGYEDIDSLDDLLEVARKWVRVSDENGYEDEDCFCDA